jgi:hypothetical protein
VSATYHRVFAASLDAGMGAGGAKPPSPEPFIAEPLVAAPGGPAAVYSAIVTRERRVSVAVYKSRLGRLEN